MPSHYVIDRERRVVFSTGTGTLTAADMTAHQERLRRDPDFDPTFSQLLDFSAITKINLTPNDMQVLASRSVFAPGAKRAFVVKQDAHYGIARAFELIRSGVTKGAAHEEFMIFRDLAEARRWLGLEK